MSGRDYRWVGSYHYQIPPSALVCGNDCDGNSIYLGRALHYNDILPCSVVPNRRKACTSYDGKEVAVMPYEILVHKSLCWEPDSNGKVPYEALPAGRTSYGETLYVGRIHIGNNTIVGKVHPSHECLFVPLSGFEERYRNYEVLVYH